MNNDRKKMTPLMLASIGGCMESVIKLLPLGADVNVLYAKGNPALSFALRSGFTPIVELLCDKTYSGKMYLESPYVNIKDYLIE